MKKITATPRLFFFLFVLALMSCHGRNTAIGVYRQLEKCSVTSEHAGNDKASCHQSASDLPGSLTSGFILIND